MDCTADLWFGVKSYGGWTAERSGVVRQPASRLQSRGTDLQQHSPQHARCERSQLRHLGAVLDERAELLILVVSVERSRRHRAAISDAGGKRSQQRVPGSGPNTVQFQGHSR